MNTAYSEFTELDDHDEYRASVHVSLCIWPSSHIQAPSATPCTTRAIFNCCVLANEGPGPERLRFGVDFSAHGNDHFLVSESLGPGSLPRATLGNKPQ